MFLYALVWTHMTLILLLHNITKQKNHPFNWTFLITSIVLLANTLAFMISG